MLIVRKPGKSNLHGGITASVEDTAQQAARGVLQLFGNLVGDGFLDFIADCISANLGEDLPHTGLLQRGDLLFRDDPTTEHRDVGGVVILLFEQTDEPGVFTEHVFFCQGPRAVPSKSSTSR